MKKVRTIEIFEDVFADQTRTAAEIREKMTAQKTLFLNVMSAPGSGKTTFLTALINRLKDQFKIGEMDVDIETSLDAHRVSVETGIPSLQIHNGGVTIQRDWSCSFLKISVTLSARQNLTLAHIRISCCSPFRKVMTNH